VVFEFLQRHLQGAETPDRSKVRFYVQPDQGFENAGAWPPADAERRRLVLGEGTLGAEDEEGSPETVEYFTNPSAGFTMAFDRFGTVAASPYLPTPQQAEGPQGVTFRTEPLDRPMDLTGPAALHLVAASSAANTDWHAKLADVAPDGTESLITDGALRASHRALDEERSRPERPYHPHTNPTPIEPGRFYEYELEIWPTAYRLAAGHRLQLRLTSTNVPTHLPGSFFFDRDNPAATRIDLNPPATNTVRLGESELVVMARGGGPGTVDDGDGPGTGRSCAIPKDATRRMRAGRRAVLRLQLRRGKEAVAGKRIRLRGAGVREHVRTNKRGRARVTATIQRDARVRAKARACNAKLRLKAKRRD
jgi:predicted acyl esterase